MCGILGYISSDKLNNRLSSELATNEKRGPDSQILKRFNIYNKFISFS